MGGVDARIQHAEKLPLEDWDSFEVQLEEQAKWLRATDIARTEGLVEALGPRTPGPSKDSVKAECKRLLQLLLEHCTREAFEQRSYNFETCPPELRKAAMSVVATFAEERGWKRIVSMSSHN